MPNRVPETTLRHGLIENAAGDLACPICREPLVGSLLVSVTTDRSNTIVLHSEVRTFTDPDLGPGANGVVVGLACERDHRVYLSVVIAGGRVTVKTEWDTEDAGSDEVDR